MRKIFILFILLLVRLISMGQEATEIIRKADQKMRGNTMQAEIVIKTTRPTWSREMQCRVWMKGKDFSMILVQAPARDKGIVFLKKKKEVWNWMPALERNIKLPPSMMNQSWMGTDFKNDDLVRESSVIEDYVHTLTGDTSIRGRNCHIIQMIPKPQAAIVWSKVIIYIDKNDFLELYSRFYDEDGILVSEMNAYDIKQMQDRLIPTRFEMIPADKKGHKTEMQYKSVIYNKPINDNFFNVEKMKTLQ